MKKNCIRLSWLLMFILLLLLSACDQIELPWNKEPAVKLTQEQVKIKIALQQDMAVLRERLKTVQGLIDLAKEHLSAVRFEHGDKFITDEILVGDNERLGSKDAKIVVVEFTDYECPYCARHAAEVMPLLKEHYIDAGKLGYYVRDFPLPSHPQAKYAAVTALCAGEQGRYWQMHDLLFKNQKRLDSRLYLSLSRKVGLDPARMSDCLSGATALRKVNADVMYGLTVDVATTPKFFVGIMDEDKISNVIMIKGAMPYAHFSTVIDLLIGFDLATRTMQSAGTEKVAISNEMITLETRLSVFK